MSAAALKIAAPRATRRARIAWWIATATIALQAVALVVAAALLVG
jgi:hypothetical protein